MWYIYVYVQDSQCLRARKGLVHGHDRHGLPIMTVYRAGRGNGAYLLNFRVRCVQRAAKDKEEVTRELDEKLKDYSCTLYRVASGYELLCANQSQKTRTSFGHHFCHEKVVFVCDCVSKEKITMLPAKLEPWTDGCFGLVGREKHCTFITDGQFLTCGPSLPMITPLAVQ